MAIQNSVVYSNKSKLKILFHKLFPKQPNDLKSTWKVIKNLISLKELLNLAPCNIFDDGGRLTEPQDIIEPHIS